MFLFLFLYEKKKDYNDTKYYINVLEVKPPTYGAVSIVETDVQLDFAPPLDYVEPPPPSKRLVSLFLFSLSLSMFRFEKDCIR